MPGSIPVAGQDAAKEGHGPTSASETSRGGDVEPLPDDAGGDRPRGLKLFLVVLALLLSMFLIALDMVGQNTRRLSGSFAEDPYGYGLIDELVDRPSFLQLFPASLRLTWRQSVDDVGWYASAFFITLAAFQSLWGKMYQYFDLKLVFLASVSFFEVGSLICAVAQNSLTLIVGRAIAGLGGAGTTGGVYTIMAFIVPAAQVPKYIGLVGAVFSVASVAGPLLGGVFSGEVTWRWCFYLNLPVGGFALGLLVLFLKTPSAAKPVKITTRDLFIAADIPGIILCLGALISFTLAMQWGGVSKAWSSSSVIGTLVGFVAMTITFVIVQWASGDKAMLVTRVLKQRTVWAGSIFIFFLNSTNFLLVYNLPQYFQIINGVSATNSGIRNLPLILGSAITTLVSGYTLGKIGIYPVFLLVSGAFLTLGAGLVYTLDIGSSIGKIIGYQIIVGVGVGAGIQVPVTAVQAFSDPQDIPLVTAVVLFFQLVSGSFCVSASQSVLYNILLSKLAQLAPNLNATDVLSVGATEIRDAFHGSDLEAVLQAYMVGIKDSWAMSIGFAGLTFLVGFAGEWKRMHGAPAAALA